MDDRKIQAKLIGAVIVKLIPPSARVAYEWAEKMYDNGVRIHPELVQQPGAEPSGPALPPTPLETQDAVVARATDVLREMAQRFPQFRPLVEQIAKAKTPEERALLAARLRDQIDPQMLATAEARAGLVDDDTE